MRQVLEARLLTAEPFEGIAQRFATVAKAIEFYEALFFNVRDRLQNPGWIRIAVLRSPSGRVWDRNGALTAEQRGFIYRFFGYNGGPLVLDEIIDGIGTGSMPQRPENVKDWFGEAVGGLVRTAAITAASVLPIERRNALGLLKLATGLSARDGGVALTDYEQRMKSLLESVKFTMYDSKAERNEIEKDVAKTPVEPRAQEHIAIANGVMPETLRQAIERFQRARMKTDCEGDISTH